MGTIENSKRGRNCTTIIYSTVYKGTRVLYSSNDVMSWHSLLPFEFRQYAQQLTVSGAKYGENMKTKNTDDLEL